MIYQNVKIGLTTSPSNEAIRIILFIPDAKGDVSKLRATKGTLSVLKERNSQEILLM